MKATDVLGKSGIITGYKVFTYKYSSLDNTTGILLIVLFLMTHRVLFDLVYFRL